ncbi:MAG: iron-sulfur cluster assembly scaffold protein [Spirochaetota bacterium]
MKNALLKDHFLHPRNVGVLDSFDHKIVVKSDQCNDMVSFTVTIAHNSISDIRFEAYGCGYAIAGASLVSEMAKGKAIDAAIQDIETMILVINNVPDANIQCVKLSLKALRQIKENSYK